MSDDPTSPPLGRSGWIDLTVPDADRVRAFYEKVVGWTNVPVDMGGYSDFCMMPPGARDGDAPAAGVCHARGVNADLPPVWMVYFVVEDLDTSVEQVRALGGELLRPVKTMGRAKYAVIRDPAGAVCALYQA
jgi:predicted enzyme related to lactoylglutathione lyase